MDGTGVTLDPLLPHLDSELTGHVIAYPRDVFLDYDALEEFVRERLPEEGPYWVAGQSFSGPLAVRLAADPPEGMVGAILVVSFVTSPIPTGLAPVTWMVGSLPFHFHPPYWFLRHHLLGYDATQEQCDLMRATAYSIAPKVMSGRLEEIRKVDVRPQLLKAKVPVGYLRAGKDRMVRWRKFQEVHGLRPDLRSELIEDAPHLILMMRPLESALALARLTGVMEEEAALPPAR